MGKLPFFRRRDKAASVVDRLNDKDFLRICYEIILGRDPDAEGLQTHLKELRFGLSRQQLIRIFLDSKEFEHRWKRKTPSDALHGARMKFVQSLRPADYIVDLGGASTTVRKAPYT